MLPTWFLNTSAVGYRERTSKARSSWKAKSGIFMVSVTDHVPQGARVGSHSQLSAFGCSACGGGCKSPHTAQPGLLGNLNRPPCHSLSALVRIRMKIRINWPLNPRYV